MKDTKQIVEEYLPKLIAACAIEKIKRVIAQNEDKWITIHPHGKDGGDGEGKDYRRLLIKDGETVEDAMHRQGYYNKRKAKDEKKQKENNKTFKERIDEKRTEYDYAYAKFQEVNKEVSQFEQRVNDLVSDLTDYEEIRKFADKYKEEHKEELEELQTKYNAASKTFQEKEKEFSKFKSDLADEMLKMDIEKLDEQELNTLQDDVKDFLYTSGISHEQRIALQEKLFNVKNTVSRLAVKAKANMVGGYTKKLNNLCGFTRFSDISSYSEDLQKHIYNNYKVVYDKYPQINYGGLETAKLKDNVYAQNLSYSNIVTLNSKHYDDLNQLKSDYENDVKKKYHPEGTDYNSIIVHELGHGLQQYIEKKYKIKAPQIRETVLKKLGIKQKDVGNYLSMYAMAKPRVAHEFFAEAFAEYMTSKNPRPLAQAFGEEINRILNS